MLGWAGPSQHPNLASEPAISDARIRWACQGGMSTPIGVRQWVPWDRKWCVGLHSRDWLDSGGAHLRDFHFIGGYPFARAEKLTFRARFEIVDFGPKIRPETAGKLQSVQRKNVPISAF